MGQHCVSLHLAHPYTASSLSAFQRLLGQDVHRPCCSCLRFVMHHVSQPLIVDQSNKDVNFKLGSIGATVHSLIAIVVETLIQKFLPKIVNNIVIFICLKSFIPERLTIQRS